MIEETRTFIENIYEDIFQEGGFSFAEATELLVVYTNANTNLEFHFDSHHGSMVYGGMYIRVLHSDKTYRLNDMAAYFDPEKRSYKEIAKPYKDKNTIDLRTHAGIIKSHLLSLLTDPDFSWEPGLQAYLKAHYPFYK